MCSINSSSSGPLVSHHPTPIVASNNHSTPGVASGPPSVPVVVSNSSSGTAVSVPGAAAPHHVAPTIHHVYPQPSVAPTAPPPGTTVPHGVNSVSSTSGAQVHVAAIWPFEKFNLSALYVFNVVIFCAGFSSKPPPFPSYPRPTPP